MKKTYRVEVVETIKYARYIQADSPEDAEQTVWEDAMYSDYVDEDPDKTVEIQAAEEEGFDND